MTLRSTTKFTTKDGKPRKFWGCSRFPECRSIHGAHPDGKPLGIPATKEVKALRSELHRACEKIWGPWNDADKVGMYAWLKENTQSGHIGMMQREELEETIWKVNTMIEKACKGIQ